MPNPRYRAVTATATTTGNETLHGLSEANRYDPRGRRTEDDDRDAEVRATVARIRQQVLRNDAFRQAEAAAVRPPIPVSLAHRPVQGGLALPWVNTQLADGGVDFRSAHQTRFAAAWLEGLCQSCGTKITGPVAILLCGPRQLLSRRFDEPPACPPCAVYASKACPMVAGRLLTYPDRKRVAEGRRGEACTIPGCDCGGWVPSDPEHSADHGGQPAHPWYAVWIRPGAYQVTAHKATVRCPDRGCLHDRTIINGAFLLDEPLKVTLASEPGKGRVWQQLTLPDAEQHAQAWLRQAEAEVSGG